MWTRELVLEMAKKDFDFWLIIFILLNFINGLAMLRLQRGGKPASYKAAVYEHPIIFPEKRANSYDEAVLQMFKNLHVFKEQADKAGQLGVDILVFPEDGIYGFNFSKPSDIENYLEYIPDPLKIDWTPCVDPSKYQRTKVLTFLSCLAMNNSMYLVVNCGDMQPCQATDPNCPKNGHYQYNTNVVFDRRGKLIARYHKENLYFETQFNTPSTPEAIYFDTDFGRFGTFICFDILFHDPAIPLIEKYGVTDILFPTAWMDALPFFSSIGYHSSFAVAYNVNFLSANLHLPSHRFQGSGIYTPEGALEFYHDRKSPDGRLLVQDVPIITRGKKNFEKNRINFGNSETQFLQRTEFKGRIFKDTYDLVSLEKRRDNVTVCQADLCCFLAYDRDDINGNYAFGVFNGLHPSRGRPYYLQVCILLECGTDVKGDCYDLTFLAQGHFKEINIKGNFSTPYVTPQVITSNDGALELPPRNAMQFNTQGLFVSSLKTPLLEASLVGRIYDKDSAPSLPLNVAYSNVAFMQALYPPLLILVHHLL